MRPVENDGRPKARSDLLPGGRRTTAATAGGAREASPSTGGLAATHARPRNAHYYKEHEFNPILATIPLIWWALL